LSVGLPSCVISGNDSGRQFTSRPGNQGIREIGRPDAVLIAGMKDSSRGRRQRVHFAVLLCALVLLASAERRLAYLDFDSAAGVRFENNDRPDGNEIINRLVFVDDTTQPAVPEIGDACHAALIPVDSNLLALVTVRLSESRAPPRALPSNA
jgi:hypothetical protein